MSARDDLAALLNGREYRDEMTRTEEVQAKTDGLLVIFGASDDLMEFRGIACDEVGASNGTAALVDIEGLLPDRGSIEDDDELERFFARRKLAKQISAVWGSDGYSWTYATEVPHATFEIMEDGDKYCRGIVIDVVDLA